jgi:hypothetical protein
LIIAITTVIAIKISDPNTTEDFTELTHSNSSILRLLDIEKEEKPDVINFSASSDNFRPPKPCECGTNYAKKALALFNGPESPIILYRSGMAEIITLPDQLSDSAACRRADGTSMCGRLTYTFTDLELSLEIKTFPHKGIFWDTSMNQLILHPQSTDPTGLHKVMVTAYLPSSKDVLETAEIAYFVHLVPQDLPPNL